MRKAPDAFRTISEAAELLDTPAHVLRFWESKFAQLKPVKRAGGRRYYRRSDIDLLSGIKLLLHDQGMTIRGVQKLLQEKGRQHVAGLAPITTTELVEIETDVQTPERDDATPDPAESDKQGSADSPARAPEILPSDSAQPEAPPPPAAPVSAGIPARDDAPQSADAAPQPDAPEPSREADVPPPAAPIPAQPRMTRLAHLIRTQPLARPDPAKLAPLTERLTGLLAQMAQRDARDSRK